MGINVRMNKKVLAAMLAAVLVLGVAGLVSGGSKEKSKYYYGPIDGVVVDLVKLE